MTLDTYKPTKVVHYSTSCYSSDFSNASMRFMVMGENTTTFEVNLNDEERQTLADLAEKVKLRGIALTRNAMEDVAFQQKMDAIMPQVMEQEAAKLGYVKPEPDDEMIPW